MDNTIISTCIRFYFSIGLSYSDILNAMAIGHRIIISDKTLKRKLKKMGLFRRKQKSDLLEVALYVQGEIDNVGWQSGYRRMHTMCVMQGFVVSRTEVALLMSIMDPSGVEARQKRKLKRRRYFARGPNYLWHVDSYDKLKQYGLCVNGCIDGYSRKVLWCKVTNTSSNPRVVGGHFISTIEKLSGCPKRIRLDRGTENGHVAKMQEFMTNDDKSYIYGPSTGNQRIEAWWRQLRAGCCDFWIEMLGDLKDSGRFDGGIIDKNLVQFCFMPLLQANIDKCVSAWNIHLIRKQKNQRVPSGRPCMLYSLPSLYGTRDFKVQVEADVIATCREECILGEDKPAVAELNELFLLLATENGIHCTGESTECARSYLMLREVVLENLYNY